MGKVVFSGVTKNIAISNRKKIEGLINILFLKETKPFQLINYVFCSDEYLLKINQEFLKHDYYTDVVSFILSEPYEELIAEIYISLDRIKDNAKIFETKYENELLRVMIHGALHFCGYTDNTKTNREKMRLKEDSYLNLFEYFT